MRKLALLLCLFATAGFAQTNNSKDPTWWDKYQYILTNDQHARDGPTTTVPSSPHADVCND